MTNNQEENRKRLEIVAKLLTADYGIDVKPKHAIMATNLHLVSGRPFKMCVEMVVAVDGIIRKSDNSKKHGTSKN